DRIGGVLQVVGQPFFPVVLTSLSDDSVGAGFGLDGLPLRDTNADGLSAGSAGDWRSILVSQFAHDRNVAVYLENEVVDATDPGNNATARLAEFIGELGRQDDVLRNSDGTTTIRNTGDESLRLGFEVHGVIDSPNDVDVYSFTGKAGTEVWVDIDRTTHSLDTVVELISSTGNIIALSDSSLAEASDPAQINRSSSLEDENPLGKSQFNSDDLYTTNQRDAGFRVVLPGNAGTTGTYQIRVRSSNVDPLDPAANFNDLTDPTKVFDGLTSGSYQMQVRLQETDEVPGTTVWFSDIRFATNGIEIFGQPVHSPLSGEFAEGTSNNDIPQGVGQQNVGNILNTDRAAVSIAGRISSPTDVDFYRFSVRFDDIQDIPEHTNPDRFASVTFDVDYADGMSRANLQAYIFDAQTNELILTSRDSNIGDDRSGPLEGADMDDLSRGSVGELDP
ncbi:MAG: PPC domain-containing protein, partial [Planctomycetaceae bacterium]